MGRSSNKLWRNRIVLLALPLSLAINVLLLLPLLIFNVEIDIFSYALFALILLAGFLFIFTLWRAKSPLSFWRFLVFIEPYNARFYNNRAGAYLRSGAYEHALDDYNTGIKLQPKPRILVFLHNGRLALFIHMGKYAEALQEAEHALQFEPVKVASAAALYNRGYIHQCLFQYDAALRDFGQTIGNSSHLAAYAHLARGLIYAAQGYYQQALEEEDICVLLKPYQPTSYNNRATVHLKFRQYQAALEDTNQALAHCQPAIRLLTRSGGDYPYAAHVHAQRALAYGGWRNYQAALEDARKAVDLAPVYGPNFFSLGQIYMATNALAQARQAFQQGFDADSKDVSNAVLLAWTRMCNTLPFNIEEEALFLSGAAQNYPESEWGHLSLGMAAWLREDYDTALAYLSQARQRDVTNPHCYFWLGMCHASREEDDLARSALQQAAQSGLASPLFLPAKYFEMKKPAFYQFTLYFR